MKTRIVVLGGLLLSLAVTSCTSSSTESSKELDGFLDKIKEAASTKYDTKKVNDLYSVDIPDFMVSTTTLNDDATLQYNNLYKEKYIIVLDEDKDLFIQDLKDYGIYEEDRDLLEMFAEAKESFIINEEAVIGDVHRKEKKIDGLSAQLVEFDSDVAGIPEPVTYYLGFVEGKANLYTIMAWTLTDRKSSFKDEANMMIESFREL